MTNIINKEEYKRIFNSHYDEIMHFLYFKSGDVQVAEDLVQDVFHILWEKRDSIKKETVRPYLYKIAENLFINRQRKSKVDYNFRSELPKMINNESPEFVMELKEFDFRFQKALSGLKEKQRITFLMNRVEALSYTEIAERLNITVKAVEKRMQIAINQMTKQLNVQV